MAMTKAERARMTELEEQIAMARALRWPDYGELKMLPVPEFGQHTEGWLPGAYDSRWGGVFARKVWSESTRHGEGDHPDNGHRGTASQNGIRLYATRFDALRALRQKATAEYARSLARIDAEIEKEIKE